MQHMSGLWAPGHCSRKIRKTKTFLVSFQSSCGCRPDLQLELCKVWTRRQSRGAFRFRPLGLAFGGVSRTKINKHDHNSSNCSIDVRSSPVRPVQPVLTDGLLRVRPFWIVSRPCFKPQARPGPAGYGPSIGQLGASQPGRCKLRHCQTPSD